MLEVLTLRYGNLSAEMHILLAFGLIIAGALIYLVAGRRPTLPLSRSYYFMMSNVAFALLAANQLWWYAYVPAIKIGASWLLLVTDFGGCLLFGAYSAHLATARSMDAYGHGGRAWLAFVPFGNLFLLFTPSVTADPLSPRGSNGMVVAGIVLFLIGRGISTVIDSSLEDFTTNAADPEAIAVIQDLTLRAQGIEAALDALITAEEAPRQIDPDLLLTAVTRNGTRITYDFVLNSPDATSLDAEYRSLVKQGMCDALMRYLTAGATAAIAYRRIDGAPIETLALSVTECTA